MKKVLVDSNIFLDYYLDRKDNLRPLGKFAFQFFRETARCRYFVLITKDVEREIGSVLGLRKEDVWKKVFDSLRKKRKIEIIGYGKDTEERAVLLAKRENIPKTDALLIEVAKENSLILVSRNFHFNKAKDTIEVFKPEELI